MLQHLWVTAQIDHTFQSHSFILSTPCSPTEQLFSTAQSITLNQHIHSSSDSSIHWPTRASLTSKGSDVGLRYFRLQFLYYLTCTMPPFQLIQKLRNSSQERMPGVATLTRGSPILPREIQERVFCLPPSTISSISALSWGLAERAKWASLWVFTATWNWLILAGFFTYWYSYLLGVEMWIRSKNRNI